MNNIFVLVIFGLATLSIAVLLYSYDADLEHWLKMCAQKLIKWTPSN
ncbi:hypothetical protein SAMN05421784_10114 [Xenorhabdus koppenhoeferi]|uniref:Uncharacterized protein n=1 Tax=Xenorhabdus koppenhoeferi TaxID=351659 RepID=A0A1I7ESJ0_9GAMM|nr:hypothetical protein SAMN05421784_10114 [Xenorhabdus koppenhoeferi]